MDADMYDDDDDDDGDEVMQQQQQQPQPPPEKSKEKPRGNRLSDQVDMDDEPALVGYERCVAAVAVIAGGAHRGYMRVNARCFIAGGVCVCIDEFPMRPSRTLAVSTFLFPFGSVVGCGSDLCDAPLQNGNDRSGSVRNCTVEY